MGGQVETYQQVDTMGKSQLDLVIKVYDGAIKALKDAKSAYEKNDNQEGYEQMERVRKFITHLYTTLDPEKGGEIAEQLGKLYAFVINEISVIEATKDLAKIDDNITVLNNLRSGWTELKQQEAELPKSAQPVATSLAGGGFTVSG